MVPFPLSALFLGAGLFLILFQPAAGAGGSRDGPRQSFDLPAGVADETLKLFAAQAGCEIVFQPSAVAGVKTNAIRGEYSQQEALNRLLSGTGLIGSRDEKTGILAVYRAGPGSAKARNQPSSAKLREAEEQKKNIT
jgi:iron complex outermembrane receptor protein